MRINNEAQFLKKFEEVLSDRFILTPFNYNERLNIKVELTCRICSKKTNRKYYNVFKSNNCLKCVATEKALERNNDKWMSKNDFIDLLPKDVNYEILSDTINLNHKVLIRDMFGDCEILGRNLLKGTKPGMLSAIDRNSYRIAIYRSIHGNNFSYPDFNYITNNHPINIICNRCGRKDTVIDCNHIKKKSGCKICDTKLGAPKMSNEEFIKRVKEVGSEIEILEAKGEYHTPILCKNKYGLVKITPDHLLKGSIGSLRTALDKTSYMIEKFKEKHNNRYTYPNYIHCGNRCEGFIECSVHGEFSQMADVHLMGSGCDKCAQDNRIQGYSRTDFINVAKERDVIFYILKCYNEQEVFYKLGITSRTVKIRYKDKKSMPYKYESIFEYSSNSPALVWDLELKMKNMYKTFKTLPNIHFKGNQECFSTDLPIEEIIESLK